MKINLLFFIALISINAALAQAIVGANSGKPIDMNTRAGGFVTEIKKNNTEVRGNTYLAEEWKSATLSLIDGTVITDKLMRYDILMNQFEIKIEGQLKGIQGFNVTSFVIYNEFTQGVDQYINAKQYSLEGAKLIGFFKVTNIDKWSFLTKTDVELKKANYNAILDVGEEDPEYVKSSKFFISNGQSLIPVVSNNKKKFADSFGDKSDQVLQFLKDKKLSLKEEIDMRTLVNFLNTQS